MRLELMNNFRSGIDYQIYSHEVAPVHIRDSGLLTIVMTLMLLYIVTIFPHYVSKSLITATVVLIG